MPRKGQKLSFDAKQLLRQAALRNQPWRFSTGPRTWWGKRRSSRNACKPVTRAQESP